MVQVTNFLLRWLFLCRLVDDKAEVQTWPYRRPGYYEHPPPHSQPSRPPPPHHQQQEYQQQQQQQSYQQPSDYDQTNAPQNHEQHQQQHAQPNLHKDDLMDIPTYRESVIRSLTSYPPGSSERLHRLEELRLETVREFAKRLVAADEVIRWGTLGGHDDDDKLQLQHHDDSPSDADTMIHDDFQQFMQQQHSQDTSQPLQSNILQRWNFLRGHHHDTKASSSSSSHNNPLQQHITPHSQTTTTSQITTAHKLLTQTRLLLPQLVSTVLHSPPSLLPETSHPDPISSLRSLLIHRCQTNPSLGIELCWLLEAEVGRKWKALFEHRQQTGKRLILIVQADIAKVIATIGAEKASAFNLLQDAEMATAFGMERRYEGQSTTDNTVNLNGAGYHGQHNPHQYQHYIPSVSSPTASSAAAAASDTTSSSKPPRSISDLRCRHFGDSMHFIDKLTQISLDLRHVPSIHRQSHLQARVEELNRRLVRRMVSRGTISIDVEEGGGESQHYYNGGGVWGEESVREDMIRHSVHFVMEPECVCWPGGAPASPSSTLAGGTGTTPGGGTAAATPSSTTDTSKNTPISTDFEHPEKRNGVVRILRILPQNCRVLDSAQRCPFLVRMEVVETGLDANDARLYTNDIAGVGVTIQEALGSIVRPNNGGGMVPEGGGRFEACEIPPELMVEKRQQQQSSPPTDNTRDVFQPFDSTRGASGSPPTSQIPPTYTAAGVQNTAENNNKAVLSRGGDQMGDGDYYSHPDTYDMVREQHYEELHHDLRYQRENEFNSVDPSMMAAASTNQLLTGSTLLDNVFGRQWNVECQTIRQQSPYRNVPGWKLASFIIKAGEDIRKEALVMQIMSKLWTWFQEEIPPNMRPFLRPYTVMCVGGDAGIVECLPDVKSVNEVKKSTDGFTTLKNFFERAYGAPQVQPSFRPDYPQHQQQSSAVSFEKARDNFLRSLVGYSVVCYILQIKDRHNANILMDREGHIMHIDFGFVLGETPKMGKVPLFSERAPFKLSAEFWEVIGGWSAFKRFCEMFEAAYAVAAAHSDEICSLVEAAIMNVSRDTNLARSLADSVRGRIQMKADPKEQKMHIMNIVNDAITSWGTSTYDWLQRSMHGYQ
mmetsp:Transcript_14582/g.31716  ORF Transcript_14582/g.31716 Transcript_14582/m.31716 type:complete len:1109 (-) Transcript_14582:100-3426(-)|eukprot:CAMPEP_0172309392 /NCGR_PEP_ID=MMETSP1058-20130122/9692_1 /TAXON_ID=83371 /ORGANISM="Detonula confervacea, Strain CCMP 353" /LENGTH=1108 /DNA_ID=CAMNT_0013022007 /DNA_START=39 /DNA_END=3365 /DNA_ORIENTATION=+